MTRRLCILHLEDNPNHVGLVRQTLEADGIACDLFRVNTRSDFVFAVEKGGFDLVLADYSLAEFNGLSALALFRERYPDLPFIFFSGTLPEEAAGELLRSGATDYVHKPCLSALAPVIRRALHEMETRNQRDRAEEEIKALHDINLAMTSILDLEIILNTLLEKVDIVLPRAAAHIRLIDRAFGQTETIAWRNIDAAQRRVVSEAIQHPIDKAIVQSKTYLIIPNLQGDERIWRKDFYRRQSWVSYLGVPMKIKEEVIGVLSFLTKNEHEFTNREIDFAQTLAGQASAAIHIFQLYEKINFSKREVELANQYLERSLKRLSGLYIALAPLTPSESIHETMGGIIDRLMEATGADAALIRVWDKDADSYLIAGQRGFEDYYLNRVEAAPREGAIDWIVKHGEPVLAPDIAKEPRFKEKIQLRLGLRSCAMLPLKVRNEVRGIFHLASRKLGYFDEEQAEHLVAIARLMGIALENRELFDELKASNVELEKANKIKDEFLGVMSHELRTPLNIIIGYTGMVKDAMLGDVNEQQQAALQKVLGRAADQLNMINTIMQATQIEAARLIAMSFNLPNLLDELRSDYETQPAKKDVILVWDYPRAPLLITTDKAKLKQILHNLIQNALKFTDEGTVTVSVRVLPDSVVHRDLDLSRREVAEPAKRPRWAEFRVTDTGIGIPGEMREAIFDKFQRVDNSATRLYGGLGLGLYIVKKFTDLLGGTVEVESQLGKGSSFRVKIPF